MKKFYLLFLFFVCITVHSHAQIYIDGRKVLYDKFTNTMVATIPQSTFGNNYKALITLDNGWSNLIINNTAISDYYTFSKVEGGKKYLISIKKPDNSFITSNLTFTFLPLIYLSGTFGYDYQEGTMSLFMPDGTKKENMVGKLKWRGGTTNAVDKHKRNYKIKFDEDQQFFGFRKDNKWILDAGQADLFRVRNRVATEIWNDMSHKPYYETEEPEVLTGVRGQMVEVFLNDEYKGIYCLTECMDRKELKLKKFDKTTKEIHGGLWKGSGWGNTTMYTCPNYDNSSSVWGSFEVKYPELDDVEETDYSTLWNAIYFIITSSDKEFTKHVSEYFDIPVIIDYYIFTCVLNAYDNIGKNMYWAVYDKAINKMITPAVWDLDRTVGHYKIENSFPNKSIPPHYNLTNRLSTLNVNNYNETVNKRYWELRKNILSTENIIQYYRKYYNQIILSGAGKREENLWSEDTDIDGKVLDFKSEMTLISDWINTHMLYLDNEVFSINDIEWPDIPLLSIETVGGEMPTCTIVHAPEGCSGVSITDNNYIPGRMIVSLKGKILYDSKEYIKGESGMKIKRRGNSTGAYLDQHPYKIKLSKKYDLLERGDNSFKHKEWVLLSMYTWNVKMTNHESNILNVVGTIVSKILNKEWTPEYEFVNVIINGEYQGMYYLMESVDRGEKRVNLDDSGFLIEYDTFWWNEDIYFKTDYQKTYTGYTYKYPDDDDVTDDIQNDIKKYMNEFESVLYNNGDLSPYIDYESFAKWIIIHDILGTDDAAGCNKFLYKYDLIKNNPYSSKLHMGPVWDYDSTFRSDSWSIIHTTDNWFYYSLLFKKDDFIKEYINLWKNIRPTILKDLKNNLDEFLRKYENVFDENIKLHQTKFPNEGKENLKFQVNEVMEQLTNRIAILDVLMTQYGYTNNINKNSCKVYLIDIFNIYGKSMKSIDFHLFTPGIYIFKYSDGTKKKILISK